MNTKPELILGELTGSADVLPLECRVPNVVARQTSRKGHGYTVVERLYEFVNGCALGARRGGPLHLAGKGEWEIFMLDENRTRNGDPVGFIKDSHLDRLVAHYADLVRGKVAA